MEIGGRVALVTGAGSGIGRAVARALAARGAHVAVLDVDAEGGKAVASEIEGQFVAVDVSDLHQMLHAVERVLERWGALHLAHLNAGVSTGCGVGEDFDLSSYRKAMGVNLDGVIFGVHATMPALRASGGGAIVATASLAGLTGTPFDPIYSSNKHAVVGLVRSLSPLLSADSIRVNAVCPGFAESQIIAPMRETLIAQEIEIIPAETVAEAVLTLFAGEMSGECWYVQPGRRSESFAFKGVPGPR